MEGLRWMTTKPTGDIKAELKPELMAKITPDGALTVRLEADAPLLVAKTTSEEDTSVRLD